MEFYSFYYNTQKDWFLDNFLRPFIFSTYLNFTESLSFYNIIRIYDVRKMPKVIQVLNQ